MRPTPRCEPDGHRIRDCPAPDARDADARHDGADGGHLPVWTKRSLRGECVHPEDAARNDAIGLPALVLDELRG